MSCITLGLEKPKGHSWKEEHEQKGQARSRKVPDKWTREAGKWVPHGDGRRHTGKGGPSNVLKGLECHNE